MAGGEDGNYKIADCWSRNGIARPADPTVVMHPGNVNDPWDWLKGVACVRRELGATDNPGFLDGAYKAYLSGGLAACIVFVERFVPVVRP